MSIKISLLHNHYRLYSYLLLLSHTWLLLATPASVISVDSNPAVLFGELEAKNASSQKYTGKFIYLEDPTNESFCQQYNDINVDRNKRGSRCLQLPSPQHQRRNRLHPLPPPPPRAPSPRRRHLQRNPLDPQPYPGPRGRLVD